jgi:hypothetical protein
MTIDEKTSAEIEGEIAEALKPFQPRPLVTLVPGRRNPEPPPEPAPAQEELAVPEPTITQRLEFLQLRIESLEIALHAGIVDLAAAIAALRTILK